MGEIKIRFKRSITLLTTVILIVPILTQPVLAEPVASRRKSASSLQSELNKIVAEFDKAYDEYEETAIAEAAIIKRLKVVEADLTKRDKELTARLISMYKQEDLTYFDVVLGSADFNDFISRSYILERISAKDARMITESRALRRELKAKKEELSAKKAKEEALLLKLKKKRGELAEKFNLSKKIFVSPKPTLSNKVIKGVKMSCFPVAKMYSYRDTWGAPRRGHRHQGTDVFAPRGQALYAVASGTVRATSSRNGGKTIYLTSDNGDLFYYMHLNAYAVTSGRVTVGQVIGTVGSTGNAKGGTPHLHFEIHPKGGRAVNPYPYLRTLG